MTVAERNIMKILYQVCSSSIQTKKYLIISCQEQLIQKLMNLFMRSTSFQKSNIIKDKNVQNYGCINVDFFKIIQIKNFCFMNNVYEVSPMLHTSSILEVEGLEGIITKCLYKQ